MSARALPMGDRAFLLEVADLDEVQAVHAALSGSRPAGVTDLVPAARTVLVRCDPQRLALSAARAWALAAAADAEAGTRVEGPVVDLDIVYDGADVAETAALLGITADELVARHAAAQWRVAFTGFAPGFGYLVSDDWPFDVPRLASPRTRVPAGAVGLAGRFSGAYPRETPGGWRLIGTTPARLFDPAAASPALLAPGTRVRFRPASPGAAGSSGDERRRDLPHRPVLPSSPGTGVLPPTGRSAPSRPASGRTPVLGKGAGSDGDGVGEEATDASATDASATVEAGIRVVEPGLLATLQDLGRAGAASVGVAVSGALDRSALRTANRLLGNREGAAGIEVTMGGFRAVTDADAWVAVTGAWGPVRIGGRDVDPYQAHEWPAGAELHVDWYAHGARAYVAVRGGFGGDEVLGSRATDLLAGLGPAALRASDVVTVRADAETAIPVAPLSPWGAPEDDELELDLAPGPRADWFGSDGLETLFDTVWTVTNDADRVGVRLDGPELVRARADELASEGMVAGALQVPPSGRPTILLADGPVTGGYPVIAVVTDAALDLVAQARPGTRIRFRHARVAE